ncbi:protein phosphatase (plasmid) [Azospirillum sp. B510]|uniref:PP2C family protein-serine/threonine phosphatase n=1 Tax=Azospirillum sp. (strain B510) TaxID=137722 RepID=UPI0001C4BC72|nr:PP2C family serine/threonine-protein phosphatase [Azospirillum sp. B510]BAI74040.1 protein phosphatase [Azospirillum sp. B510]
MTSPEPPALSLPSLWPSAGLTRQGVGRSVNEDAILSRPDLGLWAVADGIGGQAAGDVASRAVIGALAGALESAGPQQSLDAAAAVVRGALTTVNRELLDKAAQLGTRSVIATTIAMLLVRGDEALCLWAGDSRIYLLRDVHLYRLTRDHTVAADRMMAGLPPSPDPRAAQSLTRAVGARDALTLDLAVLGTRPGDLFLVCTDGVWQAIPPEGLAGSFEADPDATVRLLAERALAGGTRDDLSAVVTRVCP